MTESEKVKNGNINKLTEREKYAKDFLASAKDYVRKQFENDCIPIHKNGIVLFIPDLGDMNSETQYSPDFQNQKNFLINFWSVIFQVIL